MPRIDQNPTPNDDFGESLHPSPLIFSYTRAQALAEGVLVDVTDTAKEAGFVIPVALTAAVWAAFVQVPEGVTGQDERGRLWDVLSMLRVAIRRDVTGGPELHFELHVRHDNSDEIPPLVALKAVCGPDDDTSPCITVMLPEED